VKKSGSIGFHFEALSWILSMYETPVLVTFFVKTEVMALREIKEN
jgi:hypothetical protein